jgi:hypothetical protein
MRATLNQMIMDGASLSAVRRHPNFLALDGTAQLDVVQDIERIAATRESRAASREARLDAAENRAERRRERQGIDLALNVSDPDVLVGMSRNDVINLRPHVGTEETKRLVAKWDALKQNSTKLVEARIDKQDFDKAALDAGLRPNKPSNEAEKDKLVRLQSHVENVIDTEQRARGNKTLTREEKREIVKREVNNLVTLDAFFGDRRAPRGTVSQEEIAERRAYVEIGPKKQRVNIADIPDDYRTRITNARAREGRETTEAQLAELWLRSSGKFKDK